MTARAQLAALGRHLHRSALRHGAPAALLARWLDSRLPAEQTLLLAQEIAAAGGERARALHAQLDALHAPALAQFAAAADAEALGALWRTRVRAHGHAPQQLAGAYWAVLTHPLADRSLRHEAFGDMEMLQPDAARPTPLQALTGRRSLSPRRLGWPAPPAEDLEQMLAAALAAPDHGRLQPWRVIEFPADQRPVLAQLFEQEKRRRDPLATAGDLQRARSHATDAPCLLAFVVTVRERRRVPAREQWLAAGAALGNLLNAAHALGYGAIVLSGERCFDAALCAALGLAPHEVLAGFVSIGSAKADPPHAVRPLPQTVWRCWSPQAPAAEPAAHAPAHPGSL